MHPTSYSYSYSYSHSSYPNSLPRVSMRVIATLVAGSALFLAGCAVGPNYSRPAVPSQAGWKEQTPGTNTLALPPAWWEVFNNAELNALQTKALDANQDLKAAIARVTEARALARVAKADLYPSVSAGGAYSRNRISENRANAPKRDLTYDDFSTSFD